MTAGLTLSLAAQGGAFSAGKVTIHAQNQPGLPAVNSDPTRLMITNEPMLHLIALAYGLADYQVAGPDWLRTERLDLTATMAAPASRAEQLAMLGPFLTAQFDLRTHRETKTMRVFVLTPAGNGKTPKPVTDATPLSIDSAPGGEGIEISGHVDIGQLARYLALQLHAPVLDETGLAGNYPVKMDFANQFTPVPGNNDTGGSISTALKNQMGLRLETRTAPVEILTVDHANQAPLGPG